MDALNETIKYVENDIKYLDGIQYHGRELRNHYYRVIKETIVKLVRLPGDKRDRFIDANFVRDTFPKWIVAQGPLDGSSPGELSTLEPFWMMIDQNSVAVIGQLCKFGVEDTNCARYYPEEVGEEMECGVYKVKTIEKVNIDGRFTADQEHISVLRVQYTYQDKSKTVDILRHFNWEKGCPPETVTPAIEMIQFLDAYRGNVLVHCCDGHSRSMLLASIKMGVEICEREQREDMAKVLSTIRNCRQGAIETPEEHLYFNLAVTKTLISKHKPTVYQDVYPFFWHMYETLRRPNQAEHLPQIDDFIAKKKSEWEAKRSLNAYLWSLFRRFQ